MSVMIKDLCINLQKPISEQGFFDSFASNLFNYKHNYGYVMSNTTPPLERYNIRIDHNLLNYKNDLISNFTELGPNEKYLVNKILNSSTLTMLIVGGIGVGKSKFIQFFISDILTNILHSDDTKLCVCPFVIELDLMKSGMPVFTDNDVEISSRFSEWLCDSIEAVIHSNFFDINIEVTAFIDDVIKFNNKHYAYNSAISSLLCKLREHEAITITNENREVAIINRKLIRSELFKDTSKRRNYLAALLKYIQKTHYAGHEHCMLVVIDNIDQEPAPVIRAISKIIKPFCNLSNVRTIVTARQTTYSHYFDDGFTDPVESAPYCGAGPIDIIAGRLDHFISNPSAFVKTVDYKLEEIVEAARVIKSLISREPISSLIRDICGNSNRTALLLAQRLFSNGVYLPIQKSKSENEVIKVSDINKALMVGLENSFDWNDQNPIENIFEVNGHPCSSYFIKLRILRMIGKQSNNRVKINGLLKIISAFGYTNELIYEAIHQLMLKRKRLVWSDAVRYFDTEEHFLSNGTTHLSLTDSGKGYGFNLYKKLMYLEEVMLSTHVALDNEILGEKYDYNKIHNRFRLVHGFVKLLLEEDIREVTMFNNSIGAAEYFEVFKEKELLSKKIAMGLEGYIKPMIESRKQNAKQYSPEYKDFLDNHLSDYSSVILMAEKAERELLHKKYY